MLFARLRRISQEPDVSSVFINTSQHSHGFFAKVGFVVESIVENGFAPGLHEYKMSLPLTSETRERLLTNVDDSGLFGSTGTQGLTTSFREGLTRRSA